MKTILLGTVVAATLATGGVVVYTGGDPVKMMEISKKMDGNADASTGPTTVTTGGGDSVIQADAMMKFVSNLPSLESASSPTAGTGHARENAVTETVASASGHKSAPVEKRTKTASLPTEKKGIVAKVKETFTGEMCGDKRVEVEDPDLVPDHPKLTALLMTNPCFNFGFFEQGGRVAVINYIPARHAVSGGQWSFPGASKDLDESLKYARFAMDMNEIGGLLNAFTLDMVRKASGPEMVEEIKKLAAKMEQETKKAKPRELDQAIKDTIFWDTVKNVARQEGLSVRLSDATREREAADKIPGDFLLPGGTADRYKMILARMSPSGWEKFELKSEFAGDAYVKGNYEQAISLRKEAISYLQYSQEIEVAVERTKKYFPEIADRILAS